MMNDPEGRCALSARQKDGVRVPRSRRLFMTLSLCPFASGSVLLLALLAAGRPAASGETLGLDWRRDLFGGIHSFIQRASIAPDRSLRVLESFEVCDYAAYPCTSGVVKSALAADLNGD